MTLTAPPPVTVSADESQVLFREARLRRRRRRLMGATAIVAAAGIAFGLLTAFGGSPPQRPRSRASLGGSKAVPPIGSHIYVRGNGIGDAYFGQTENSAIAKLEDVLGSPSTSAPASNGDNCGIDAYMQWPTMTAYFGQERFIGYSTVRANGFPRSPSAATATSAVGLRVGDTLARARAIYGSALTTSFAQGGSWFAATSSGRLAGNLTDEVNQTKLVPRIEDITAGSVGCPAASP